MGTTDLLIVTSIVCTEGADGRLLDWKRKEGEILQRTPGFVERLVARSTSDPLRFVYLSRWSGPDGLAELQADPAYGELAAAFGIPMFSPEVRDAKRPVRLPVDAAAPFQVVSRMRVELIVAERALAARVPQPGDLLFSYDVDTGADGRRAFVEFKTMEADGQLAAPGFFLRYLGAVSGEDAGFFYASVWDGRPSADRFHEAFVGTDAYREYYGRLAPFHRPPSFTDSRVELAHYASTPAGSAS